jgi:hypothetical protein
MRWGDAPFPDGHDRVGGGLSTSLPNPYDPHPELDQSGGDPRSTPVHAGWNGTAGRNGETVNVYVEGAGRVETR